MFRKKFLLIYTLSSILCTWMQPTISQNSIRQNKSRMTRLRERALKFGRCVVGTREFQSEEKQVARATFVLLIGGILGAGYVLKRHLQRPVPSGPPPSSDSEGAPVSDPPDSPSPSAAGSSSSGEEDRVSLSADKGERVEKDTHRKEEAEKPKEEEEIPLRFESLRGGFWDPNSHDPVRAPWTRATFAYCFGT